MSVNLAVEAALARVPPQWSVLPLRRLLEQVKRPNSDSSAPLLSLTSQGEVIERIEMDGLGRQAPSEETIRSYWLVEPNQLVVNPMWLVGGSIGVSATGGAVSPAYRIYQVRSSLDPRYLHNVLRSVPYLEQYRLLGRGDTTFDRSVTREDFEAIPIPLPSWDEQRTIADFLDDQLARIENTIAARQLQRDLLSQRSSGLLGQLYETLGKAYGLRPLRQALSSIRQGWSPQCEDRLGERGDWIVLKAGAVNGGVFRPDQHKVLPPEALPRPKFQVHAGDLLMSRANGSLDYIGNVALVEAEPTLPTLLCDKIYRLTPTASLVDPRYLVAMLGAPQVRDAIRLNVSGAEGMANSLPSDVVRGLLIPLPPADVQRQTVGEVEALRAETERHVQTIDRLIGYLRERKQCLITTAVTGQLDSSEAA